MSGPEFVFLLHILLGKVVRWFSVILLISESHLGFVLNSRYL